MVDYVIVGAGSAGCVLANRLSADPAVQVSLLEAGGSNSNLLYRMPAGFFPLMKAGKGNWNYETVPQPGLGGRTMYFPRGKVLGGSSSINGLVVSRGNPGDYDHWGQLGNHGWSWDECLPFFRRIESYQESSEAWHGRDGPVGVTRVPLEGMHPVSRAWIEAGVQAGHPFNPDPNSADPYGMAQMQGNWRGGVRQSAAESYLKPVLSRPNLKVLTGATVTRIIVEHGRARAIEFVRKGKVERIDADREIILSGGVVNSPQVLMLSGIGDPDELQRHGIAVRHALPGVGRNLKDHMSVTLKQQLAQPLSLLSSLKPLAMAKAFGQFMLFKSGPIMTSGLDSWAHLKTRPEIEYPDLQVYCVNLIYNDHGRDVIPVEGFMAAMTGLRPRSVGRITLGSADPLAAPRIDPGYFSDPEDVRVLRDGLRLCRDIVAQQAFDDLRADEYAPGAAVQSDDDLDHYIRQNAATLYHPIGTCRMGSDDLAVVDPKLRVRGIDGLRVVDASIMPEIISGNTNFPTMMIAEKAAAMIDPSQNRSD